MKVFLTDYNRKCGGCNDYVDELYGIGKTEEEAKKNYLNNKNNRSRYGLGLCSVCLVHLLIDRKYEIKKG